ncbi:hypothetical protein PVAND_011251 [Polypedilum vanderplanki]|uniref:Apolipoprotein D n=1 Tax=Polypedilum vanderplanki TaxID=319348 RepID=A0A9J6CJD3_POLVA|nr:hypothetical protein PVAND_011251 [Polypedilum vanderplanki]
MKNLIIILALIGFSQAEIFDRPCRTPEQLGVKTGFMPALYLGIWYEIERYEQFFQISSDCSQAQYTLNADGSINVVNTAFIISNQTRISDTGRAIISFPDEEPLRAMLNVTFSPEQPSVSNYWVLSTDYSNYAFVVSCSNLQNDQSLEQYWLLSRSPTIAPAARIRADELVDLHLDRNRIRTTIQDNTTCERI